MQLALSSIPSASHTDRPSSRNTTSLYEAPPSLVKGQVKGTEAQ